jgi:hypothetical protein
MYKDLHIKSQNFNKQIQISCKLLRYRKIISK